MRMISIQGQLAILQMSSSGTNWSKSGVGYQVFINLVCIY